MKELTYKEFQKRISEVNKARRIFIDTGITDNYTAAFEMYQAILAQEKMEVLMTTQQIPMSQLRNFERPKCEDCGADMKLKPVPVEIDGVQYQCSWVCIDLECGREEFSELTPDEWISMLRAEVEAVDAGEGEES